MKKNIILIIILFLFSCYNKKNNKSKKTNKVSILEIIKNNIPEKNTYLKMYLEGKQDEIIQDYTIKQKSLFNNFSKEDKLIVALSFFDNEDYHNTENKLYANKFIVKPKQLSGSLHFLEVYIDYLYSVQTEQLSKKEMYNFYRALFVEDQRYEIFMETERIYYTLITTKLSEKERKKIEKELDDLLSIYPDFYRLMYIKALIYSGNENNYKSISLYKKLYSECYQKKHMIREIMYYYTTCFPDNKDSLIKYTDEYIKLINYPKNSDAQLTNSFFVLENPSFLKSAKLCLNSGNWFDSVSVINMLAYYYLDNNNFNNLEKLLANHENSSVKFDNISKQTDLHMKRIERLYYLKTKQYDKYIKNLNTEKDTFSYNGYFDYILEDFIIVNKGDTTGFNSFFKKNFK